MSAPLARPKTTSPVPLKHGEKYCPACCTAKPRSEFYVDRFRWDDLRRICKQCDHAARNVLRSPGALAA